MYRMCREHLVLGDVAHHSSRVVGSSPFAGQYAGAWLSFGMPDLPVDQRMEDAVWLTWTSTPLMADMVILGSPRVCLINFSCHTKVGDGVCAPVCRRLRQWYVVADLTWLFEFDTPLRACPR